MRRKRHTKGNDKGGRGYASYDLRALLAAWEQHAEADQPYPPARYCDMGRRAMELGHATLACEILRHGLMASPDHRESLYLAALASVKAGSYSAASALIQRLLPALGRRSPLYSDARSLEGRNAKDRWARLPPGPAKQASGEEAVRAYEAAYAASHAYFPGVNAATMNLLIGRASRGRELAGEVRALCLKSLRARRTPDHWLLATLGEACLLLGDQQAALAWYRRAAAAARRRVGDIATMRRQLRLLETVLPVDPALYAALAVPNVAVFTGHMLDRPGRSPARFPPALQARVAREIAARLDEAEVGFGYCSAACGADILFIEALLGRGAEVHVTLPFDQADFLQTSVAYAGTRWVRRFESALQRATSVSYAVEERYLGDDILFEYTASLTQGAALLRARQLETGTLLMSVVDEADAAMPGGTRTAMDLWSRNALPILKIDLRKLRESATTRSRTQKLATRPEAAPGGRPAPERPASAGRQIKTMLFADMVGFSKLHEEDTPAFLVHFLGEIARVIGGSTAVPAFLNTWGDGLFMVFDEAPIAAEFALQLRDAVRDTDWKRHGLPPDTSIRIGMHSGPVFPALDPIIGRINYFGSHVNRAARIEPVAAPGTAYVSEQTASLLAASGADHLACDFLGSLPLAKHFGASVLYRLRRSGESE